MGCISLLPLKHEVMVRLLLRKRTDINLKDYREVTELYLAVKTNDTEEWCSCYWKKVNSAISTTNEKVAIFPRPRDDAHGEYHAIQNANWLGVGLLHQCKTCHHNNECKKENDADSQTRKVSAYIGRPQSDDRLMLYACQSWKPVTKGLNLTVVNEKSISYVRSPLVLI